MWLAELPAVGSLVGQLAKADSLHVIGVDIYFENTGGPIQHHVFSAMNAHGRIVVCGMIADYGKAEPDLGPNWIPTIKKRLTLQGFAMPDYFSQVPERVAKLTPDVMEGKIKYART